MKRDDSLQRCFAKDPSVVTREIAGEVILVPVRQAPREEATIYTLNEVSAFIWEQIDGQTPVAAIRDALVDEFEVKPEEAEADLVGFLQQLEQVGAVNEVSNSQPDRA
jgi:hypothetical protein